MQRIGKKTRLEKRQDRERGSINNEEKSIKEDKNTWCKKVKKGGIENGRKKSLRRETAKEREWVSVERESLAIWVDKVTSDNF